MAKITTYYFTGPVMFACLFERNMDSGEYAPEGGQFKIMLGLTKDDLKTVKKWSHMYQAKTVDDFEDKGVPEGMDPDRFYITFKRDNVSWNRKTGEKLKDNGPPRIIDSEGNPWDHNVNVGNGSICTLKIDVYTGVNGKGKEFSRATLEAVRVDDHVPYEGNELERETVVSDDVLPF